MTKRCTLRSQHRSRMLNDWAVARLVAFGASKSRLGCNMACHVSGQSRCRVIIRDTVVRAVEI